MANPAVIVVAGVVIAVAAVAAVLAFFDSSSQKKPMRYDQRRRRSSPPSSPPPSSFRRSSPPPSSTRRRETPTCASTTKKTCQGCQQSPYIKVNPCGHESRCERCFKTHLISNDTCPDCNGRIDSCSPEIPPYRKCEKCRKFAKLFKFLPCNHSLSMCISCFEEEERRCRNCPQCNQLIRGSEPTFRTSGICIVCSEFTRFAMFQPCGHGTLCQRDAEKYLNSNGRVCTECDTLVTKFA